MSRDRAFVVVGRTKNKNGPMADWAEEEFECLLSAKSIVNAIAAGTSSLNFSAPCEAPLDPSRRFETRGNWRFGEGGVVAAMRSYRAILPDSDLILVSRYAK